MGLENQHHGDSYGEGCEYKDGHPATKSCTWGFLPRGKRRSSYLALRRLNLSGEYFIPRLPSPKQYNLYFAVHDIAQGERRLTAIRQSLVI